MIALALALGCAHEPPEAAVVASASHISAPPAEQGLPAGAERDRMLAALKTGDPAISACYQQALGRDPKVYGELVLWIELTADGAVRALKPEFSTLPDPALSACVLDAVRALKFPTPSRDGLTLRYPYVFTGPSTPPEVTRALLLRHGLIAPEEPTLSTEDLKGDPDAPPPAGVIISW